MFPIGLALFVGRFRRFGFCCSGIAEGPVGVWDLRSSYLLLAYLCTFSLSALLPIWVPGGAFPLFFCPLQRPAKTAESPAPGRRKILLFAENGEIVDPGRTCPSPKASPAIHVRFPRKAGREYFCARIPKKTAVVFVRRRTAPMIWPRRAAPRSIPVRGRTPGRRRPEKARPEKRPTRGDFAEDYSAPTGIAAEADIPQSVDRGTSAYPAEDRRPNRADSGAHVPELPPAQGFCPHVPMPPLDPGQYAPPICGPRVPLMGGPFISPMRGRIIFWADASCFLGRRAGRSFPRCVGRSVPRCGWE